MLEWLLLWEKIDYIVLLCILLFFGIMIAGVRSSFVVSGFDDFDISE